MQTDPRPGSYFMIDGAGYLRLTGETRLDFLQRQTTNQIKLLKPGHSLLTVLTSPTARIVDVLVLLDETEAVGVLTLPGRSAATARYLQARIFFNDRVMLQEQSALFAQIDVFGAAADTALEHLGVGLPMNINAVSNLSNGLRVLWLEPVFGLGYRLVLPVEIVSSVETVLEECGLRRLTPNEYTCYRVEAGLPGVDHELTEAYTPFEIGLQVAVSSSKGCYTGQEVLARQVTYDKVNRLLCGLRLSGPVEPGSSLLLPDNASVGVLTSIARSPQFGWIGLGVVRRPYTALGTEFRVGTLESEAAAARVTQLPFRSN